MFPQMFAKETDGNISLSQAPGSCTETQTPYDQPTAADGTVVGLNFVLVPSMFPVCRFSPQFFSIFIYCTTTDK